MYKDVLSQQLNQVIHTLLLQKRNIAMSKFNNKKEEDKVVNNLEKRLAILEVLKQKHEQKRATSANLIGRPKSRVVVTTPVSPAEDKVV
jgi:epoxyqueuosine reductase QueG